LDLWKSLFGVLTLEFTGAVPEKTMEAIVLKRIDLDNVIQKNELTYQIQINRRDYRKLSAIFVRRGDNWRIIGKKGLYWSAQKLLLRPVLLVLILFLFTLSYFLPSRIFFITVEGNTAIPAKLILSAAENCGIRFGASRKMVRSEKAKNTLLSAVPQLQWAGINTYGCTAVISVKERAESERSSEDKTVSSLIADRDGFILSTTVTSGTAHVFPGEAVTKGQLLISGYTDCGICIRASEAKGEILALTDRSVKALMPRSYHFPVSTHNTKYNISLIIGKKRINLWKDSSISDASCGRMYEEYFVSLPGGFRLPLGIGIDRYQEYEIQQQILSESDAQFQLQQFSENYLLQHMIAGQILERQQNFSCYEGLYKLESGYTCTEMIGSERREQIGVTDGKGY